MHCINTVNDEKIFTPYLVPQKASLFISFLSALFLSALFLSVNVTAAPLQPFNLASIEQGDYAGVVKSTQGKLQAAGFKMLGEYQPYPEATILIVTNDELLKNAAATEFGGYGAMQRIAITRVGDDIQISFTNPVYMSFAYHMAGHLESVEKTLKKALGFKQAYGSVDGLSREDLKTYQYMFGMPYFTDLITLNKYHSYEKAIEMVKMSLEARKGGAYQVFFQEIPDKKQAVFGVGLTKGLSADTKIMDEIDFHAIKSTAHLPYEMLVYEDGSVYILSPKFRISINFIDLEMSGKHSFAAIMNSPAAIRNALIEGSGGEVFDSQ